MTCREREMVAAIRDTAEKYLAAANHAEQYIYGVAFARAMMDYNDHALASFRKESGVAR